MKRLFLDIETSLMKVTSFSLWPKYISHDAILQDWHIICACWKWQGEKKVHSAKTYSTNDKKVVKELRKAILEADELVYHNGKKFDYKKLNTRVLLNGLDPMSKPRETDTLIQARKHFGFTSNRLDYIGQVLGVGGKEATSSGLWMKALEKDKKAIDEMEKYCKRDVVLLEEIFDKMLPFIDLGMNKNLVEPSLEEKCPKCGSNALKKHGWQYTKSCKYQRYICTKCRSFVQGGTRIKLEAPVIR